MGLSLSLIYLNTKMVSYKYIKNAYNVAKIKLHISMKRGQFAPYLYVRISTFHPKFLVCG